MCVPPRPHYFYLFVFVVNTVSVCLPVKVLYNSCAWLPRVACRFLCVTLLAAGGPVASCVCPPLHQLKRDISISSHVSEIYSEGEGACLWSFCFVTGMDPLSGPSNIDLLCTCKINH